MASQEPNRRLVLTGGLLAIGGGILSACGDSADSHSSTGTTAHGKSTATSAPPSNVGPRLTAALKKIDSETKGVLSAAVYDHRTGHNWTFDPTERHETASIVKVLVLSTVCYRAQKSGRDLTAGEKTLADAMIRFSDNNATSKLWASVGGTVPVQQFADRVGMKHTKAGPGGTWGITLTTAPDQILLMNEIVWQGKLLQEKYRRYILSLMGNVTPEHRWGVGRYGKAQVKNGWLPYNGRWVINSIGHVGGAGRDYTLTILQTVPTMDLGTRTADRVAKTVYDRMADKL